MEGREPVPRSVDEDTAIDEVEQQRVRQASTTRAATTRAATTREAFPYCLPPIMVEEVQQLPEQQYSSDPEEQPEKQQ